MKVVENAYGTIQETLKAVYRLVKNGDRSLNDILIVTNDTNYREIINSSPVRVDAVPLENYESIWSTIQSLFTNKHQMTLIDYGVDATTAREYQNAIRYGKYVILVDDYEKEDEGEKYFNWEETRSRLQDTERRASMTKKFGPGLDLDDPGENKTFGRTPQQ